MRRPAILFLVVIMAAGVAINQTPPSPSTALLGPHNSNGRGCASCHTASSFESASATESATVAPWGPSTLPLYGKAFTFGDNGRFVEVLPTDVAIRNHEVDGILLCLSCHDGNVTPPSMMAGQSYEQTVGLLPSPEYGSQPIPTLLGSDNYANDHPVGTSAVIRPGNGLVWSNNTFTIVSGSPYAQFVSHYGRPSLAPGQFANPWGITNSGEPFVLCTTCHNQHVMSVYTSTATSPIAGDGGGKFYPTFFFVNGPYDPAFNNAARNTADSTTQFCRQCHFSDSNEANNASTIPTFLPNF